MRTQLAPAAEPALAHVDWLSFTVHSNLGTWVDIWSSLHVLIGQPLGALVELKTGWNGYARRVNIGASGEFGLIAHGGASQRGSVHVSLNAHACARIKDWGAVAAWGREHQARVVRLDLAHDDFEGASIDIAKARRWLDEGGFSCSGRPPFRKLIDDLGTGTGSTLYVGKRESGKLVRVYEKGKQLGDPLSPWVRVEVEWRGKDRLIPWDALVNSGEFLAGAYPCLAFLSQAQSKVKTCKLATKITYDGMVRWVKTAAGPAINAMLMVNAGDAIGVVEMIYRDHLPKRLVDFQRYLPHPDGGKGSSHVAD